MFYRLLKKMRLPKTFRMEKDLDGKIEDLLNSESLDYNPRLVNALLYVGEEFLEQEWKNYDDFYQKGLELVGNLKYGLKDVEELSKRITPEQNSLLGIYLSVLINKKITEKDTVTLTLEEDLDCVGMYLRKGTLIVEGNVNDNTGCYMKGGELVVKGNAYDYTGWYMEGGDLVVKGNANDNTGCYMKGGKLTIKGDSNDLIGHWMQGGKLVVNGKIKNISENFQKGIIIAGGRTLRNR